VKKSTGFLHRGLAYGDLVLLQEPFEELDFTANVFPTTKVMASSTTSAEALGDFAPG
jgi:hypothetical protein